MGGKSGGHADPQWQSGVPYNNLMRLNKACSFTSDEACIGLLTHVTQKTYVE